MKMRYVVSVLALLASPAHAVDNGQWGDVPDNIRSWFKSVKSPRGVPCCDIADGHRTQYEIRGAGFWIPNPLNEQEWIEVPPEAVVYNAGNPVGEAVVWWVPYATNPGGVYVRCFVPGAGI